MIGKGISSIDSESLPRLAIFKQRHQIFRLRLKKTYP